MHIILTILLLFSVQFLYCQKEYNSTAVNRYGFSRNDTNYVFYAKLPSKKQKLRLDKNYYWYLKDTIMITRGAINGKMMDGVFNVYYPHGNYKEKGQFRNGLKTGTWRTWNTKGELTGIQKWKRGVLISSTDKNQENDL